MTDEDDKDCPCIKNSGLVEWLASFTDIALPSGTDAASFFMGNNVCSRGAAPVMIYANVIALATMYATHLKNQEGAYRDLTEVEVDQIYNTLAAAVESVRPLIRNVRIAHDTTSESLANASSPSNRSH